MENARSLQESIIDFDAIPNVFRTAVKVNSLEEVRRFFEDGDFRYNLDNKSYYDEKMFEFIISEGEYVSIEYDDGVPRMFHDDQEFYEFDGFEIVEFSELPMVGDALSESEFDIALLVGGV